MRYRIMRLKNSLIIIFSGILVIGFLAWILILRCSEGNSKVDSNDIESKTNIIPVRVINLKPEKVEWGINTVGIILPDKGVQVLSELGGRVKNVYFTVGSFVKKGTILAKLDDEYKQYDLIRAEAQLMSAKADLEKSELDLKRYEKIAEAKGVSQYDKENVRLKRDVSRANFLTAESMFKTARRVLEDTEIKAPFDGFISQKMVEVGNTASIGTPVAKLIDIRMVKLSVEVAERDIINIKVGNLVKINVDVYPDIEFLGKVTAVSPEADVKTRTFPVEIKLSNTDDFKLKSGMIVKGKIITDVSENIILLPQEVVREKDGTHFVFLNKGDRALKNIIEVGRSYNNRIEIKE